MKGSRPDLPSKGPSVLKRQVISVLSSSERPEDVLDVFGPDACRRIINPIISLLYSGDPELSARAVGAFGVVISRLADQDMEAARVVMRRLMWSLNDESGGIGWGAPEAMGEAMARHETLAVEYAPILLSYIREDGNYLEYEPLRKGAMRGIRRLAEARPSVLTDIDASRYLMPYLGSTDRDIRRLAGEALSFLSGQP